MTINIQYERLPFNEPVTEFVINKLNALSQKYQSLNKAQVVFRRENEPSGKVKVCKIELDLFGKKVTALVKGNNIETAVKETTGEIENRLKIFGEEVQKLEPAEMFH